MISNKYRGDIKWKYKHLEIVFKYITLVKLWKLDI